MNVLKKLIKLAVSIGLAISISNTLINTLMSNPDTAAYYETTMKSPIKVLSVILTLAFYSACTLSGILWEKGFVVSAIISYPFAFAITGALGIGAFHAIFSAAPGEISLLEAAVVIVLGVPLMLWAPIVDIVKLIRRTD